MIIDRCRGWWYVVARDPNRDKAGEIWREHGGKITNRRIAELLGIDEKKVAVWKQRDGWSVVQQQSESVVQHGSKRVVQQKGRTGAPKGNQNAKGNRGGNGGPPGNKKAVRTGEFETIWMDTLEADEQELLAAIDTDPIRQADEAITLLTIRERRMLLRIQQLTNGLTDSQRRHLQQLRTTKEAITVHDEKTGKTNTVVKPREELVTVEIEETTYRKIEDILRIEEALTRVQGQKIKAIELKNRLNDEEKELRTAIMQIQLQKLQGGAGATQSWTDALKEIAERRKAKVTADE